MPLVAGYERPETVEAALELLARPDHVALAGGTTLNGDREHSELVAVDLQALGLDAIGEEAGQLHIGAMATIDGLMRHPATPDALRAIARAEQPSTLRTLATIGGLVAGPSGESTLLAALLVHDATVETVGAAAGMAPLADLMLAGLAAGSLVTAITIDPTGPTASASTARTPADVPIVAAVARRAADDDLRVALTGVAATPVLVDAQEPTAGLAPPGDFRGSSEYRLRLAETLSRRAIGALA